MLTDEILFQVAKPGQYLGNEWGSVHRNFDQARVRLSFVFPDIYELGMSNFGQRILYQIVNSHEHFMADRSYAPGSDLEELIREREIPLWGWESRRPLRDFELLGFSLAYELTYTNVLNILELAHVAVRAEERETIFPLTFGGGPSAVNPEPMAPFMDFFIIGDGEKALVDVMEVVHQFKNRHPEIAGGVNKITAAALRKELLIDLATNVDGVYVPSLYETDGALPAKPTISGVPERVERQIQPLDNSNQPTSGIVPYLALVHDRQTLEVRRGCDRGCRFCQPGYTFLPVRERSADDLVKLSKEAMDKSGYQEYSLLSLCVSDYTSLHDAVRALNREHTSRRASLSFPSQRADRMNFDIAEELKVVRKSGITLAPEAGTERLRAVINKGLNNEQIISAITSAYAAGWASVKLYFMIGLPLEEDADLQGIVNILLEATERCRQIRKTDPNCTAKRDIEFTCTLSNFVPKPFTPFQWFGQVRPSEIDRKQKVLREMVREARMRNVTLNFTGSQISLLESVISRGDRQIGELIYKTWKRGATFDAWDDRFKPALWQQSAQEMGLNLEDLSCDDREVGSSQPWDVVHVGLANWWLVNEWKKALAVKETAPCSENTCHACGICTELDTTHVLAAPSEVVLGKNPFVKKLETPKVEEAHPSLQFEAPSQPPPNKTVTRIIFEFSKLGDLKFIGHLDLQHLLTRAARRARLNVAFSEGFNPSPKLELALSLALYCEGEAEVAEIDLADDISAGEFARRMNQQLPAEIQILRALTVEKSSTSLAQKVGRATYSASLYNFESKALAQDSLRNRVSEILALENLEVEMAPSAKSQKRKQKKGQVDRAETTKRDIRPGIYSLKVVDAQAPTIEMELAHGSRLHIKPSVVLEQLVADGDWRLKRKGLLTEEGTSLFDHFEFTARAQSPAN